MSLAPGETWGQGGQTNAIPEFGIECRNRATWIDSPFQSGQFFLVLLLDNRNNFNQGVAVTVDKPHLSNWKSITSSLIKRIERGELVPGSKLPTEEEIAETFAVSRSTAHRAVAELQRHGLVERKRRWGTVVCQKAAQKTHLIALIFDRIAQQFDFPQAELIKGIQTVLGDNFSLIWCDSQDDPKREARFLRRMSQETDGIICFPIANPENAHLMESLSEAGFPIILLDRIPAGYTGRSVISDDTEATRKAILDVTKRSKREILFLSFQKPNVSSAVSRLQAYKLAMRDSGLPTVHLVKWLTRELETSDELLQEAVHDSLYTAIYRPIPIQAVYCVQDSLALAASQAFRSFGMRVPDDIEIITVNEWPALLLETPWQMTRIVRRKEEIGNLAGTMLHDLIDGKEVSTGPQMVPADLLPADPEQAPEAGGYRSWLQPSQSPMKVLQ